MPSKVEVGREDPPGPGYITMSSLVTHHFPARGDKPPVTLKLIRIAHDYLDQWRWHSDLTAIDRDQERVLRPVESG